MTISIVGVLDDDDDDDDDDYDDDDDDDDDDEYTSPARNFQLARSTNDQ